jgi:large subunit ribosomal protein L4
LSAKAQEGELVLVDALTLDKPKTREMVAVLENLVGDASALILLSQRDAVVERSANNLPDAKTLRVHYLNIRDLLSYDKVLMPLDALEVVKDWLGSEALDYGEEE